MIEPLLEVFDYGTPPFVRLLEEFRRRVVEEAAASGEDLILTYVWGLELDSDVEELTRQLAPYLDRGAPVSFVELAADLHTRLERNRTEHRLAEKRSKRDLDWSETNVREMERRHVMNTDVPGADVLPGPRMLARHRHFRLDTSERTPEQSAERILDWLRAGNVH